MSISKNIFNRIGIAVSVTFVVNIIVAAVINKILGQIAPYLLKSSWVSLAINIIPLILVAYPIGILIMKSIPDSKNTVPPQQRKLTLLQILCITCASFGIMILVNSLGFGFSHLISALSNKEIASNNLVDLVSDSNPLAIILFTVVLGPIFEELFFRKLLYNKVASYGDHIYIIFSSLIFGMFHANLFQSLYAFITGVILGYVYIYTGNIIYTISIHVSGNFLGLGISPLANYFGGEQMANRWNIIAVIIALLGIILFFSWLRKQKNKVDLSQGTTVLEKKSNVFLNAGMIIFYILVLINMLVIFLVPM